MKPDKQSSKIKDKANTPINPPDNWNDIEPRGKSDRVKGPAQK